MHCWSASSRPLRSTRDVQRSLLATHLLRPGHIFAADDHATSSPSGRLSSVAASDAGNAWSGGGRPERHCA